MTELEAFIIGLDEEMKKGLRAEQALRIVVTDRAIQIREQIKENDAKASDGASS